MSIDVNELLAPIPGSDPAGEDAGFSDVFDRIREARRADDASLAQGEWQTELKVADWREAQRLAEGVLRETSKDLQVAAWLAEALIAREGLQGARDGFAVMAGLLEQYWEGLHPRMEDDDVEERAGKLAWFANYGSKALHNFLLNEDPHQPCTLAGWIDSREVDNLARQNAEAYQAALDDGRINGETYDSQLMALPNAVLEQRLAEAEAARESFEQLSRLNDERLGREAPSLAKVDEALKRITQIYARLAASKGMGTAVAAAADIAGDDTAGTAAVGTAAPAAGTGSAVRLDFNAGNQASKEAALGALREIAGFFRRTEPHSPVPYLVERAIAWANLPLEQWLAEVVRDEAILGNIRERVGLQSQQDE